MAIARIWVGDQDPKCPWWFCTGYGAPDAKNAGDEVPLIFFTRYGAPKNIWLQFLPKICSMGPILLFYDCFRIRIVSPTNSDTLITPSWHSNVLKTSKMYKEQFIRDHPRPQNWKRQYNCAVLWHVHRSPCCSSYIGGAPRTFGAGCEPLPLPHLYTWAMCALSAGSIQDSKKISRAT